MCSRIVAIILSLLLFFSSLYIIGFPETGNAADTTASTTEETTEPTETVICSFKDISYGPDEKQTLDLNLPIDNRKETGLLVFLHGGGWIGGDKITAKNQLCRFTENKDYATASINYRLAELGKTDIYNIIDDITAALSHIKSIAAGYSVNINKVILYGYSAGGHLALLYAYRYKDISPIEPAGVIVCAPAVDLALDEFYTTNDLGDEKHMCVLMSNACGKEFTVETRADYTSLLKELSPTEYISDDCVPTVIAHGKKDKIAHYKGSEILDGLLTASSVEHDFITFENSGHKLDKDEVTKEYTQTLMQERINKWLGITA